MRRTKTGAVLVAALLLVVMLAAPAFGQGQPGKGNSKSFRDVEGHWAEEQIGKMLAAGMFQGVSADSFDPNGQLTRAQIAVILTRAMGLEAQAEGDGPPWRAAFGDEGDLPGWARNHIRVCYNARLMLGEVRGDGKVFNPNKPLTRVELVVLLVRAAGLEAEAQAKSGDRAELAAMFTDHLSIPDWAVGYVLVALGQGWVAGYADGTFQPNKPVTRGESAALLERLEGVVGRYWTSRKEGTLVSVTATTITITPDNDDDEDPPVLADDETYTLADGVKVYIGRIAAVLGDLQPGWEVKLYIQNDEVVYIQADLERDKVEGVISAIDTATPSLTVTNDEVQPATETTYVLADSVQIYICRQAAELADLRVGWEVKLYLIDGEAVYVQADPECNEVEGVITIIDTAGRHVTMVRDADSVTVIYDVAPMVDLTKFAVGDKVEAKISDDVIMVLKLE